MQIPFIDLKTQYQNLKLKIHNRIDKVLEHGQYIMGPEVAELEDRLANYTGSKYCVTVSSGTEALLISLMALDIGIGDEVITTPFTYASTAEVIALLGAKPVFVDIDKETFNINANLIEKKITKNTKAIIPVSLYGQTSDMDQIANIAKNNDIIVIEDAAQSFGATYRGKKSCNLSDIGCTSFFPSKPLGCYGDGGAIFTNDIKLADILKKIRIHGQSSRYIHERIGVGGRMDTIQCAIILAKLDSFDEEISKRQEAAKNYDILFKRFSNSKNKIQIPVIKSECTSVFAQYTVLVENRDQIIRKLSDQGIPSTVYYPLPLNQQNAYKKYCCPDCTNVSNDYSKKVLSLPISAFIKKDQQEFIVKTFMSD
jgi:UDP-2-acetamido-2-deoxy-ribo-hexuluronate aminotransferase